MMFCAFDTNKVKLNEESAHTHQQQKKKHIMGQNAGNAGRNKVCAQWTLLKSKKAHTVCRCCVSLWIFSSAIRGLDLMKQTNFLCYTPAIKNKREDEDNRLVMAAGQGRGCLWRDPIAIRTQDN